MVKEAKEKVTDDPLHVSAPVWPSKEARQRPSIHNNHETILFYGRGSFNGYFEALSNVHLWEPGQPMTSVYQFYIRSCDPRVLPVT
jgi:hypothetical protein